jgi:hypothetical protein
MKTADQTSSVADIRRLALMKQLVDAGHPIGTIATLGTDALLAMPGASFSLQETRADLVIIDLPGMRDTDVASCGIDQGRLQGVRGDRAVSLRAQRPGQAHAHDRTCRGTRNFGSGRDRGHLRGSAASPWFDDKFLADLSGLSRVIECECPKHLADLVLNLGGFEQYSAECASRSPGDVVLHLQLQRAAGLAR